MEKKKQGALDDDILSGVTGGLIWLVNKRHYIVLSVDMNNQETMERT